eukprot:1790556-Rhodomonas_salina.1
MAAVPFRVAMNLAFSATVWWVAHNASVGSEQGSGEGDAKKVAAPEISILSWAFILAAFGVQQVVMNVMFVSQMAFFAKVSEPRIGGTYMTLLNTIANLGGTSQPGPSCALDPKPSARVAPRRRLLLNMCLIYHSESGAGVCQ